MERIQAEKCAEIARRQAPVVTGRYRDSIHVEQAEGGAAVVADALNTSGEGYAAYVEIGTSFTPAHHTLLTALEAIPGAVAGIAAVYFEGVRRENAARA